MGEGQEATSNPYRQQCDARKRANTDERGSQWTVVPSVLNQRDGRDSRIRTGDLRSPRAVRYRTAPCPEKH